MKYLKTMIGVAGLLGVISIGSQALGQKVSVVKVKIEDGGRELKTLSSLGMDIAGINLDEGSVDVVIHSIEELQVLKSRGLQLQTYFEVDQTLAPDDGYHNYDMVSEKLAQFTNQYPEISQLHQLGTSLEGRTIWAIKISDNPQQREAEEPTVLFNSLHHAREIMTVEVTIDMIEYLLGRYGDDSQVTHWVDHNEIWVVPMVNPDGSHKVWTSNSMWRKNTRSGLGVDLNRNYPHLWGHCEGSSDLIFAQNYRGPSPASEPETQVMMDAVAKIQPVFNISYHAYSEMVIYPFGCDGMRTPPKDMVETIGKELAAQIPKDHTAGTYDVGTAWELLYNADGSDIDWMFHEHQVIPFVIEVNSSKEGFQPSYSQWRDRTVASQRGGWMYLLDRLNESGIRGVVKGAKGKIQANSEIQVELLNGVKNAVHSLRSKNDGSFHLPLKPGMYRISSGDRFVQDVIVGSRRIDLNVNL